MYNKIRKNKTNVLKFIGNFLTVKARRTILNFINIYYNLYRCKYLLIINIIQVLNS